MLTLTRRANQRIFVGDDIVITVVEIAHGMVRLGIEAPKQVPIYREEILPLALHRPQPKTGQQ